MRRLGKALVTVVRLAGVVGVIALLTPAPSFAQDAPPTTVVRPGGQAAQQPFQALWGIPYDEPGDGTINVPAGKRLVLEFASISVSADLDCNIASISFTTSVGGTPVSHKLPTTSHWTVGTRNLDMGSAQIRLYADPGTEAGVNYGIIGTGCDPIGALSVSGYFMDVPPDLPTAPQD
jgi:hypothetical protein